MNQTKEQTWEEYLNNSKVPNGTKFDTVILNSAIYGGKLAIQQERNKIKLLLQDKLDKISFLGNELEYCEQNSRKITLEEIINLLK